MRTLYLLLLAMFVYIYLFVFLNVYIWQKLYYRLLVVLLKTKLKKKTFICLLHLTATIIFCFIQSKSPLWHHLEKFGKLADMGSRYQIVDTFNTKSNDGAFAVKCYYLLCMYSRVCFRFEVTCKDCL